MNYPLVSEYIDAIRSAEENFDNLNFLRPVFDDDGNPVMSSGNFAVVFKMTDGKKNYAIKCFIKDQSKRDEAYKAITLYLEEVKSPYLISCKYYENELFVDTQQTTNSEFPVLLMDWIEGITLTEFISNYAWYNDDCDGSMYPDEALDLTVLPYKFELLAEWIKEQDFAHGDIKPDNIIVCNDGSLKLIDYDGMYVPSMKGQLAREMGSPDFRHPNITKFSFNERIDDFPLISIALSLEIISEEHRFLNKTGNLLFTEKDYKTFFDSNIYKKILPLAAQHTECARLLGLFLICLADGDLINHSITYTSETISTYPINTEITEDDLKGKWTDEFGIEFNRDGSKLLSCESDVENYTVPSHVKIICDNAFDYSNISSINLNRGLIAIGEYSFSDTPLKQIIVPETVIHIGQGCFCGATLELAIIKGPIEYMGDSIFAADEFSMCIKNVVFFEGCKTLGSKTFKRCPDIKMISLPSTLRNIGDNPFYRSGIQKIYNSSPYIEVKDNLVYKHLEGRKYLISFLADSDSQEFLIDENTDIIGEYALANSPVKRITLPRELTTIRYGAFNGCSKLTHIEIPSKIKCIDEQCFADCVSLHNIKLPSSLEIIKKLAFNNCKNLSSIYLPNKLSIIEENPFSDTICSNFNCDDNPIFKYEGGCLYDTTNKRLIYCDRTANHVIIKPDTEILESTSFEGCKFITNIIIPRSVRVIKDMTFWSCERLQFVSFNSQPINIDKHEFEFCKSLRRIYIYNNKPLYDFLFQNIELRSKLINVTETIVLDYDKLVEKEPDIFYTRDDKKLAHYSNLCRKEYIIPEGTEIICDKCFTDIYEEDGLDLQKVEIPSSLKIIGDNVFNCNIKQIISRSSFFHVINDMLLSSDNKVLYRYTGNNTEVVIPDCVEIIKGSSFADMLLTKVIIPSSVNLITSNPFINIRTNSAKELEVISYSSYYTIQDGCLFDSSMEQLISYFGKRRVLSLPNSIKNICWNAFSIGLHPDIIYLGSNIELMDSHSLGWIDEIYIPQDRQRVYMKLLKETYNVRIYNAQD